MATTKIWSVKNRLDHVLEYVSNEDKTIDNLDRMFQEMKLQKIRNI